MTDCQIAGRAGSCDAKRSRRYLPLEAVCELEEFLSAERGFVPADEVLLFRQKDPKPCPPVCGPSGVPPPTPRKMARELALLKQLSPRSRFGVPAPPRTKAGDTQETPLVFKREAKTTQDSCLTPRARCTPLNPSRPGRWAGVRTGP